MFCYHRHILFFPDHLFYWANEGTDGLGIVLGTVDEHLVAKVYYGISIWHAHMTVVQDTATYEVASQELSHLHYGTPCQSLVCGHKRHLVRNDMWISGNLVFNLLLLLCQRCACENANQDCRTYNTHNTKRICTGIAVGNGRCIGSEDIATCFGGSTKTGGVCYGATEHTHHHGQVTAVLASHASAFVEYKEVQADATKHIEQNDTYCQQVHRQTTLLETLKEARTYL